MVYRKLSSLLPKSALTAYRTWISRRRRQSTDVFGISYPKSGSTWMRFLLGKYIQLASESKDMVLYDGYSLLGSCQRAEIGPSMFFTHAPLRWEKQSESDLTHENVVLPFAGKKIIFIVRYPLDVLVSLYMQFRHQAGGLGFSGSLDEFATAPATGLQKLIHFHNLWGPEIQADRVHLLRYEDVRKDTRASFEKLLGFLEIPMDESLITAAIDFSSFENMRKLEQSDSAPRYKSSGLRVFATGDQTNPDAFHVRKGQVGGYKEYFSADLLRQFEARISNELDPIYGYSSSSSVTSA